MPASVRGRTPALAPFEGVEKLLCIRTAEGTRSLRARGIAPFERLVAVAGAAIVSHRATPWVDSFVLSESSLFVWDDRLLLLTCGRTHLAEAALVLIDELGTRAIAEVFYTRHGERHPWAQPSTFVDDAARVAARLGPEFESVARSGEPGSDSLALARAGTAAARARLFRVFCFDVDARAAARFGVAGDDSGPRAALAPLESALDGAEVHDHRFVPVGYSLNAVRGEEVLALHVSPEPDVRFASLVTTDPRASVQASLLAAMRAIFLPGRLETSIDGRLVDSRPGTEAPLSRTPC